MKEKLGKLTVLVVISAVTLAARPADGDLVAHWKLDEPSGTTAGDSTGNGYNGKLLGGLSFDDGSVEGAIGKALHLDGSEDRIYVDLISLPPEAFTVAFWFNSDSDVDSSSGRVDLMYWGGPDMPQEGDKPFLTINNEEGQEDGKIYLCVSIVGEEERNIMTTTDSWKAATWYHIAVTYDGSGAKIYINGVLQNVAELPGRHYASSKVCFGGKYAREEDAFPGKLDDIRIYDKALSANEILVLKYSDPALAELMEASQGSEGMVEKEGPQKAIAFFETKIADARRWRKKNPDRVAAVDPVLSDLRLQLAEAKGATGDRGKDVAAEYKDLIQSGQLSLSRYVSALLGLYRYSGAGEFENVIQAAVKDDSKYLVRAVGTAEAILRKEQPKVAVIFLEQTLAAYDRWREQHPDDFAAGEDRLAEIYFQLAKAGEAAGLPEKDIAEAYAKTFTPSDYEYMLERTTALIWLLEKGRADEYTGIIRSFARLGDGVNLFHNVVRNVCRELESRKSLRSFERLLDAVLAEAKDPIGWVVFLDSCLMNKGNRWAQKYFEYLDEKPVVRFRNDRIAAAQYMGAQNFTKAAELYRDILSRCGPEDDKGEFEFQLGRCLFYGGDYAEAVSRLESFIAANKATHRSRVQEARLMTSQAYIHFGELDKAFESYSKLMVEYPESKDLAEVGFFMGYCYMLKDKLKAAEETFNNVIGDYPDSPYAARARLCVVRIRDMTEPSQEDF